MNTDERLLALARRVGAADVVDAIGRRHRHRSHILDLASPAPGRLLFGPAVTLSFFPACEEILPSAQYNFADIFDQAVGEEGRGKVLVMASNGYPDVSMAGGTKLSRLVGRGLAGVLADGRIRDFDELSTCDLAVYCRGEALKWGGDTVTPFEANRPVVVGGVAVRPGDYVFADGAGAVVIPAAHVSTVMEDACETLVAEADVAREWRAAKGAEQDNSPG